MVILELMKLLTLVVVGSGLMLLMLGGIFLVSAGCGILLFCSCIVTLLPFLVLSSIVMTLLVWLFILLFGLLGGLPERRRIADIVRDVALLSGPLRLWDSGLVSVPLLLLLLRMSVFGRTLLISWSS